MARPMPRLAPVTMLLGLGKGVVDSLRDFLEGENFDEWRAVHQRRGGVDNSAAHAFLVILLHQLGVVRIVQRRQRLFGLDAVLAREFRHPVLEVVRRGPCLGRHGMAPVFQAELCVFLGEVPRRDGRAPRPGVLGQRKIAMHELHPVAVLGQDLLVHHHPEVGAVRALQVLINDHTHRTARAAFDEALRRESDGGKQQSSSQTFGHMRIDVSKTKVKRVSDGTFTRWPLVTSSAPAPAAPPAPAPITAPLPPPAMPPMIAPNTAPPPATLAVRWPRESLSLETLCVLISTIRPSTFTDIKSSVSTAVPVSLPDSLASTSFTTTSAPRGIIAWPSNTTGSSMLAAKVCPTRLVSESTPSIIRTTRLVPAGSSTDSRGGGAACTGGGSLSGRKIVGCESGCTRRSRGRSSSESDDARGARVGAGAISPNSMRTTSATSRVSTRSPVSTLNCRSEERRVGKECR